VTARTAAPPLGMPWRTALLRAATVLWLPPLVPVGLGLLADCGHCGATYLLLLPIVPGVLVPVLLGLDDAWFGIAGAAVTLALFGVVAVALRELPRALAIATQALVSAAVAFEAIGLAYALRA
jgi:hypothetical protein